MKILLYPQDSEGNRITVIDHANIDIPNKMCFQFRSVIDLTDFPQTNRLILLLDFDTGDILVDNILLTHFPEGESGNRTDVN